MTTPSLEAVRRQLDKAKKILDELLKETVYVPNVERVLRRVDLMVDSGLRAIKQGEKASQREIIIFGQVCGYNCTAINNLGFLYTLPNAKPYADRLSALAKALDDAGVGDPDYDLDPANKEAKKAAS